jgi:hypothetical protein
LLKISRSFAARPVEIPRAGSRPLNFRPGPFSADDNLRFIDSGAFSESLLGFAFSGATLKTSTVASCMNAHPEASHSSEEAFSRYSASLFKLEDPPRESFLRFWRSAAR